MEHARSRPAVRVVNINLVDALPTVVPSARVEVVVCMRDTVLHLPDPEAVVVLIDRVVSSLAPGGRFVLTYRDLTQPLLGIDRFIPVRSDPDRDHALRSRLRAA